ncbi:GMC oxidoreductase-domain-containing protein [Aspergillus pseudocaelatus]|uniref:GMC oxidoreductase-domain-containing protein n=1 Tax=Aspergillus pseudocaelatus TaxID=1825620 RepID=A0ABQ6WQP6_9EURO|nr:GMC oxidoreductase-domain-containing protein [Aspergillus pseudocaelatus]
MSEQLVSSSHKEETSERVIKSILRGPDEASACLLLSVIPGGIALLGVILSFPFSRGSTQIASSDPNAKPIIDTQFFANSMDIEILARHVQNLHKLTMSPALQSVIQPTEVPQDMEVIKEMLRESAVLTTHRTCGTVAMLPQQVGGVADQDLRVYGTKVLRVVGASIFPLTPHANLMMTVYAVAEKAADVIQSS